MSQHTTIGDRILDVVRTTPQCTLDEVTQQLQEWPWQDVFFEVDRLSRSGRLALNKSRYGLTTTLHAL
jgi:hypothetical protein